VCACGALVIGLGVKARNPEDDRKDARMLLVFLEVAAPGLLALYLLPMLGLGGVMRSWRLLQTRRTQLSGAWMFRAGHERSSWGMSGRRKPMKRRPGA
jgi:hypothetical protein